MYMEIKVKKLIENAVLPARAHKGDAGFDLTCSSVTTAINECNQLLLVYHTGLAVEIPEGYVGLLFPRSSIYKKSLSLANNIGVIDSGYRGEVIAVMRTTTDVIPAIYKDGDKFAQLIIMPIPDVTFVETEELSESDRGESGFGSTDSISADTKPDTEDVSTKDVAEDVQADSEPAAVSDGDTENVE